MATISADCPICSNVLEWEVSLLPDDKATRFSAIEVPMLYALAARDRQVFCECCQQKYQLFTAWDLDLIEMRAGRVRGC